METLTKPKTGSRRKIHQDKTPKDVEKPSNGPDADTLLMYLGQIEKQEAVVALQKKKLNKIWKLAINAGLVRKDLELVRKFADQDADTVLATISRIKQYAKILDVPIGHQLSLLDVPTSTILSSDELGERAYRAGYVHGVTGKNQDLQAYPSDNEHSQKYLEGYYAGQKVLSDRIQPLEIALNSDGAAAAETVPEDRDLEDEA